MFICKFIFPDIDVGGIITSYHGIKRPNGRPYYNAYHLMREDAFIRQLIETNDLENEGRIYGGRLKKIEPKELSNVKCS